MRQRTSIQRAGHSNWIIGGMAVLLLVVVGVGTGFVIYFFNRFSQDEQCTKSVVQAQSERSSVLSPLSQRRQAADDARQYWNYREQLVFQEALGVKSKADQRRVKRDFTTALDQYLAADARYQRLNTRYNQAAAAHPVPTLHCSGGQLEQPTPTVTESMTTTTGPPIPTPTIVISTAPRAIRTVHQPGRTIVTTAPPGKGHGRHRHGLRRHR